MKYEMQSDDMSTLKYKRHEHIEELFRHEHIELDNSNTTTRVQFDIDDPSLIIDDSDMSTV